MSDKETIDNFLKSKELVDLVRPSDIVPKIVKPLTVDQVADIIEKLKDIEIWNGHHGIAREVGCKRSQVIEVERAWQAKISELQAAEEPEGKI